MATTFPIGVRIGAALDGSVGAAFGKTEQQLVRLGDAVSKVDRQQAGVQSLREMTRRSADLGKQWRDTRAAARAYEASLPRDQGSWTPQQVRHLEVLQARTNAAAHAYMQLQRNIEAARTDLRAAGVDVERLATEEARLGQQTEELRGHYARLGHALADVKAAQARRAELRGQMVDAVALGGAIYGLTKPAIAFESAMADVKKVVDFPTPKAFDEMGQAILKMSTRIPMSAEGLSAIVASGGQAGIARDELLGFAESAAKMGVAFDIAPERAGELMAKWRSGMKLSQGGVVALADAVNHLSNNSAASAADISDVLLRVGALGKASGFAETQMAALGSALLSAGAAPDIAATALKNFSLALGAGESATKAQRTAFSALGLDAKQVAKDMQTDAVGTSIKVLERLQKLPKYQQNATASEIFGKESLGAIAPLLTNLDGLKSAFGMVSDASKYTGSMESEFAARSATTANSLQLLKNQVSRLAISAGSALLPAINRVVGAIGPWIGAVADLAHAHPEVTAGIVGVVTAAMGLKVLMISGGYVRTFGSELLAMGRVAKESALAQMVLARMAGPVVPAIGGVTGAVRALGLAIMTTPVGWLAAGIAAVAVAGLAIYKYWQPIKAFVAGVGDGIGAVVERLTGGLSPALGAFEPVARAVGAAIRWIGDGIGAVVGWFSDLLTPVQMTTTELDAVGQAGSRVGDIIGRVLVAAVGLVTAPLRGLVAGVQAGWSVLAETMGWNPSDTVGGAWASLTSTIGGIVDAAEAWVGTAWDKLVARIGFDPMPGITAVWQPVADFIGSVINDVGARIDAVLGAITDKIAGVRDLAGKAVSWLTMGAFGDGGDNGGTGGAPAGSVVKPAGATPAPGWWEGWFGDPATKPAPVGPKPGAALPAPANANTPGGAMPRPASVAPAPVPATRGALALAPAPTASVVPVPQPAPQPITVTVAVNLALTAAPDTAALAAQLRQTLLPEVETKVRGAIDQVMRDAERRRGAALHD